MKISKLLSFVMVASAASFIACAPGVAQWQTPDHSVPIGRGAGTGYKFAAPGTSGQALLSTGASSDPSFQALTASSFSFTQGGTGAVSVTFDQLYRGIIVTPEMFGDGVACSSASSLGIQKAITYIASLSGRGTVQLSNCTYTVSGPITIASSGITLRGYSPGFSTGTQISFSPSGSAQCAITIANGASIVSNTSIQNLAITTSNTTTYKIGICASDGSVVTIRDVFIRNMTGGPTGTITGAANNGSGEIRLTVAGAATNFGDGWAVAVSGVVGTTEANSGWPIIVVDGTHIDLKGSTFTNVYVSGGTITASSVGIQTKGRELFQVENTFVSADLPLRISVNPNYATSALDQSHFTNMTLGSAIGTNCIVMADTATYLTSVKFLGTQSWGGGKDGFCWRDKTGAAISQQLRFDNVRAEQKTASGGTYFNVQPAATLYSLQIVNPMFSDRDGVLARNVANLQIDNAQMLSTGKCLDIDSTVQNTQINGGYWLASSTATLSGQTLVMSSGKNPSTGCLAPYAVYANSAVAAKITTLDATTINAFTLAGTVSGGGNQINNAIIGTSTPLAGFFTTVTANAFVPNSSSVPTNGIYLPAANTLGWAINSAAELQLTATALSPAADGGNSLGTTALGWQNLFGNTGFVWNIENGDWVATHTAGILTIGTGDLRVTTAGTNSASVVTVGGTQTLSNKTFVAPALGTPASGVATNLTGTASGLTAGNVTTNANLTGVVTSVGNATSLGSAAVTSANLKSWITDETGTGLAYFQGGDIGTPSAGVGTNITGVNAAQLGGATFSAPGAIGGGTPGSGAFTTLDASGAITGGTSITAGTNSVSGGTFANGPSSGTGAGSQFVSRLSGASNIGMGNYSRIISGGPFDATPTIYMATAGMLYLGGDNALIFRSVSTAATSSSTGTLSVGGGLSATGAIWAGTYLASTPTTVGTSGTSCAIKGARWFVTDNNTALAFGAVITSGGSIQTPIYCDGTVWRQGALNPANDNIPATLTRKYA